SRNENIACTSSPSTCLLDLLPFPLLSHASLFTPRSVCWIIYCPLSSGHHHPTLKPTLNLTSLALSKRRRLSPPNTVQLSIRSLISLCRRFPIHQIAQESLGALPASPIALDLYNNGSAFVNVQIAT
ncbi:hypothetical protein K469DRAFT_700428, partial [Zopfia rhizophila CBS 207.26]